MELKKKIPRSCTHYPAHISYTSQFALHSTKPRVLWAEVFSHREAGVRIMGPMESRAATFSREQRHTPCVGADAPIASGEELRHDDGVRPRNRR